MAVRSRQFWGVNWQANSEQTLFTVPADRTALLRLWTAVNVTAGALQLLFMVNSGGTTRRHWQVTIPAGESSSVPCPIILKEGDSFRIQAAAYTAGVLVTHGYGSLLDGDPA